MCNECKARYVCDKTIVDILNCMRYYGKDYII